MSPAGLDEQRGSNLPPVLPRDTAVAPALPAALIDSGFSFRHLKADKERKGVLMEDRGPLLTSEGT